MRSAAGVHWVPRTRYALVVSDGAGGVHRSPSAACLRSRLHPLVSFAPLQSPPSRVRRRCLHRRRLPWGSRSLIAASPGVVRAPSLPALGAFPSAAFLTPSTACAATRLVGLFHPTATSRVCSSGVFPRKQPRRLVVVASHALSPVVRRSADDVATAATNRRPALRAFAPLANPSSTTRCLAVLPIRSPLELRLLQVLSLAADRTPSRPFSLVAFARADQDPAAPAFSDCRRRARHSLARAPTCSRFLACRSPCGARRGLRFTSRRLNRAANRFRIESLCEGCATISKTRKKRTLNVLRHLSLWTRLWGLCDLL